MRQIKNRILGLIIFCISSATTFSSESNQRIIFFLTDTIKSYQPSFSGTYLDSTRKKEKHENNIEYYDINDKIQMKIEIVCDSMDKINYKTNLEEYIKLNKNGCHIYLSFLLDDKKAELEAVLKNCPQLINFVTKYLQLKASSWTQNHFSYNDKYFFIEKNNFLLKINKDLEIEQKIKLFDEPSNKKLSLYSSINMIQFGKNTLITGCYIPKYPYKDSYYQIAVVDINRFKVNQLIHFNHLINFTLIEKKLIIEVKDDLIGKNYYLKYELLN
jgi:hypothetical protein